MKRYIIWIWLCGLVPLWADTGYIAVEKAKVLEKPNLFAKVLGTLSYGSKVELNPAKKGTFYSLKYQGKIVYLHESALNKKKITITADSKTRTSTDEITAATKGFDEAVESNYKTGHAQLRYDLLDKAEMMAGQANFQSSGLSFRKLGKLGEYKTGGGL
ncbi:MAG: hypothetical protein KBA26_04030 [Candidatus Delongbacteria bacterium]|nr:hypothetical protein [Candidatus Delongbacteria bacterium]